MQLLDNSQIFYVKFSSDSIAQYVERSFLEYVINLEPSIFVDVGSNPVNTVFCCCLFLFFFLSFFFTVSFLCIMHMYRNFFPLFPSCSMLYLLSPCLCFSLYLTLIYTERN